MASGLLSIKQRESAGETADATSVPRPPRAGTYRYFVRGHDHKASAVRILVDIRLLAESKKIYIYIIF